MQYLKSVGLSMGLTLAIFGCGGDDGPNLYDVNIDVTLDGKPVPTGDITFVATAAGEKPYAGKIVDGKSTFQSEAGNKRVEISSMQVVPGKQVAGGTPGDNVPGEAIEEQIPEKYNRDTTLTAEVKADGDNTFTFDLKTAE